MLVELKDVEVFVEPTDILTQAIEEGDISIDSVIYQCVTEEGAETVLDAVDNSDITEYVKRYDLLTGTTDIEQVFKAIKQFTQTQKALLLWQLLKCEEV